MGKSFNFASSAKVADMLGFKSEEFGNVRIFEDENNEIWFCLADLCRCLGIDSNTFRTKDRLDDDLIKNQTVSDTLGRNQKFNFVSEAGMYEVVIRSNSPKAKPFRKWVCGEVLPSIRKHGAYISDDIINDNRKLRETIKEMQEEYSANKEKIDFADSVLNSESSMYIAELASYLTKNNVKIGRNSLFKWLKEKKYIYREGDTYIPCARYMKKGYFDLRMNVTEDARGRRRTSTTLMTTSKGMGYFLSKLMKEKAPKEKVEVLSLFDVI